jgi:hypothetical protein
MQTLPIPPFVPNRKIPYKGKMIIPLVELAKVESCYIEGEVIFNKENLQISWFNQENDKLIFKLNKDENEFNFSLFNTSFNNYNFIDNQLQLFDLLIDMKINIYDEIDSIDPRIDNIYKL